MQMVTLRNTDRQLSQGEGPDGFLCAHREDNGLFFFLFLYCDRISSKEGRNATTGEKYEAEPGGTIPTG